MILESQRKPFIFFKRINKHNAIMLNRLCHSVVEIAAIDEMPQNISQSDISKRLNLKQSETGGLGRILRLNVDRGKSNQCSLVILT